MATIRLLPACRCKNKCDQWGKLVTLGLALCPCFLSRTSGASAMWQLWTVGFKTLVFDFVFSTVCWSAVCPLMRCFRCGTEHVSY